MAYISPPFLILGSAFIWLGLWAAFGFSYWFFAVTCLVGAGLFAWRVDAKTRKILRKQSKKED
jgi:membrane protein implicated in regulation of membrane protease activity